MMMDIGMIAYGGELERRPIFRDVYRLRNTLFSEGITLAIEVVYLVPGSLGKADFEGFQVSRSRSKHRQVLVYVDVPSTVAESEEPMPALIDLARSALEYARARLPRGAVSVDVDALLPYLDAAEQTLLGERRRESILTAEPRDAKPSPDDLSVKDQHSAGVEIVLRTLDQASVDAAFALEDEIEKRLDSGEIGHVDGNEVGRGTIVIFAYGPSLAALREAVESVVRERWHRPGARIRLLDGDTEIDTLTL
ncbi:MAG: hypothetical protein V4515_04940 [Chloroflexota bacterium]